MTNQELLATFRVLDTMIMRDRELRGAALATIRRKRDEVLRELDKRGI